MIGKILKILDLSVVFLMLFVEDIIGGESLKLKKNAIGFDLVHKKTPCKKVLQGVLVLSYHFPVFIVKVVF